MSQDNKSGMLKPNYLKTLPRYLNGCTRLPRIPSNSVLYFTVLILLLFSSVSNEGYSQESVTGSQASGREQVTSKILQQSQSFEIQSGRSTLRIYIGRAGLLSRMGHNHVIVSRDITGSINLTQQTRVSSAQILIPLQKLIVDDIEERRRAGDSYTSIPNESDKSATRSNMLGAYVLEAEKYPFIRVNIYPLSSEGTEWLFSITLIFKDQEISLEIPAHITIDDQKLIVDTNFSLNHQQLGLTPYSVMGGMLRVARQIKFELHIESVIH